MLNNELLTCTCKDRFSFDASENGAIFRRFFKHFGKSKNSSPTAAFHREAAPLEGAEVELDVALVRQDGPVAVAPVDHQVPRRLHFADPKIS